MLFLTLRWYSRNVGLDDPQRSLPTPTILWFCDSVIPEGIFWDALTEKPSNGSSVDLKGIAGSPPVSSDIFYLPFHAGNALHKAVSRWHLLCLSSQCFPCRYEFQLRKPWPLHLLMSTSASTESPGWWDSYLFNLIYRRCTSSYSMKKGKENGDLNNTI